MASFSKICISIIIHTVSFIPLQCYYVLYIIVIKVFHTTNLYDEWSKIYILQYYLCTHLLCYCILYYHKFLTQLSYMAHRTCLMTATILNPITVVMSLAVLVEVHKSYACTYKLSMSQGLLLRENKFIGFNCYTLKVQRLRPLPASL